MKDKQLLEKRWKKFQCRIHRGLEYFSPPNFVCLFFFLSSQIPFLIETYFIISILVLSNQHKKNKRDEKKEEIQTHHYHLFVREKWNFGIFINEGKIMRWKFHSHRSIRLLVSIHTKIREIIIDKDRHRRP